MNLTVFGCSESEISNPGFASLTLFGTAELRRQTLAERIMHRRRSGGRRAGLWTRLMGRDRPLVITLFGATSVVSPTIIEEYTGVRSLLESGAITKEECMTLAESLSIPGPQDEITRVTLFGVCGFGTVSGKKQHKALELAERSGAISSRTRGELAQAIGCPDRAAASLIARSAMA